MEMKINEEKEKAFLDNWFEKMRINDEKRKEMFSNTNYIKWLEGFTTRYKQFCDNDWLYFQDQISKEDNENVNNLHLLYEGIDIYAKKNYIYPTKSECGTYYNIKLDNIGYEIGVLVGLETLFFCDRKPISKNLKYIDFNDIISNKKQDNVDEITKQLKDLSNKILQLHKNGVPLAAIIQTLDTTLTELKEEEKKLTKTLKIN